MEAEEIRIDIYRGAKGALHYINNVEKDPQYKRWPRSLRQLLYPSWQLHALSRNLYTLTLVVDLTEPAALRAISAMKDLYERVFPVRFSVLPISRSAVSE